MTTGEKIKAARINAHMTQKELATACGMADSAIRKYESGRQKPKTATLKRIAVALDLPITELLSDSELEFGRIKNHIDESTNELLAQADFINSIYNDIFFLNDDGKAMLKKYIAFLRTIPEYQKEHSHFHIADKTDATLTSVEQPAGTDTVKVKGLVYSGGGVGVPVPAGAEDAESTEDTDGDPFAAPVPVGG